jgi:hypothetical protein
VTKTTFLFFISMRKLFLASVLVGMSVLSASIYATGSASSGYNAPEYPSDFHFEAILQADGKVETSWNVKAPTGFNYYKVIRSATNENPVYPEDSYIYYTSNTEEVTYTDEKPLKGEVYYRVCAIANPHRYCSNVVKLVIDFVEYDKSKANSDGYYAPIEVSDLNFNAWKTPTGSVRMTWEVYAPAGFSYYKVVRSQKNENPVYPDDGYVGVIEDSSETEFRDTNTLVGKTYYRVCAIAKPYRYCSNVVALDTATTEIVKTTTTSTPSKIVTSNPTMAASGEPYPNQSDWRLRCGAWNGTVTEPNICKWSGGRWSDSAGLYDGAALSVFAQYGDPRTRTNLVLSDISGNVYEGAVKYLTEKKIVKGYDDGTFKPQNQINRAEFTKIVIEAVFPYEAKGSNCFSDVSNEWFGPYVCFAKDKGIISGFPDGRFRPDQNISLAEASKILVNAFGLPADSMTDYSEWYESYTSILKSRRYLPQTVLKAAQNITRGEMSELIWRIKEDVQDRAVGAY